MKTLIRALAIIIVASGIGYYVPVFMINAGDAVIEDLAVERKRCERGLCRQVIDDVAQVMASDRNVSATMIRWCLGADALTRANVRRGAWLLQPLSWTLSLPCPSWEKSPQ